MEKQIRWRSDDRCFKQPDGRRTSQRNGKQVGVVFTIATNLISIRPDAPPIQTGSSSPFTKSESVQFVQAGRVRNLSHFRIASSRSSLTRRRRRVGQRLGIEARSGGAATAKNEAIDRRERLRRLALETIDLAKDPYFMRNHLGRVTKQYDPETKQQSLLFQRKESFDKRYQYLLFAAEPYQIISFKVRSTDIDKSTPKFFFHWDPYLKMFTLQLYFKPTPPETNKPPTPPRANGMSAPDAPQAPPPPPQGLPPGSLPPPPTSMMANGGPRPMPVPPAPPPPFGSGAMGNFPPGNQMNQPPPLQNYPGHQMRGQPPPPPFYMGQHVPRPQMSSDLDQQVEVTFL